MSTAAPTRVRGEPTHAAPDGSAITRRRAYRLLLAAAGVYDLALAMAMGVFTGPLFAAFGLAIPGPPLVWRCVAATVGAFGVMYLRTAWRMERLRPVAASAIAEKGLTLVALVAAAALGADEVAGRTLPLVAASALVWLVPFAALLMDGIPTADRLRTATPWICAALHAAAGLAMLLLLRAGTEAQPSLAARMAYVATHPGGWRAGFAIWMAAGMSILAFYAWWSCAARPAGLALSALAVAFAGLVCDLTGEAMYVGWLPLLTGDAAAFAQAQRVGTVLTAVFANGFYTLAGIALTLGTPRLPRPVHALAWIVWGAGIALSVCGAMGWAAGLVAASGVLFPGLIGLAVLLARTLR